MKIIEALKNLKTIQKRIEKNCEQIKQYCGYVNSETPAFETEEKQRMEVNSLIQSNLDLEVEYLRLKKAVEQTNLAVIVAIGSRNYTITELISIRRVVGKFRLNTYNSLSPVQAMSRLQQVYNKPGWDSTNPPKIVLVFKEEDKNRNIKDWEEFLSSIDGKLEVVNAETDLQGY